MQAKSSTMDDVSGFLWDGASHSLDSSSLYLWVCRCFTHAYDYDCGSFVAFWQIISVMVWSNLERHLVANARRKGEVQYYFLWFSPTHSTVNPTDVLKGATQTPTMKLSIGWLLFVFLRCRISAKLRRAQEEERSLANYCAPCHHFRNELSTNQAPFGDGERGQLSQVAQHFRSATPGIYLCK